MHQRRQIAPDLNPDPLTGAHGSHPIGTGLGATGGAFACAAMGAMAAGPVGALIGAAIGALAGGAAGRILGEAVNPTQRDVVAERNYYSRDGVDSSRRYS